jgi:hypothetical protein
VTGRLIGDWYGRDKPKGLAFPVLAEKTGVVNLLMETK